MRAQSTALYLGAIRFLLGADPYRPRLHAPVSSTPVDVLKISLSGTSSRSHWVVRRRFDHFLRRDLSARRGRPRGTAHVERLAFGPGESRVKKCRVASGEAAAITITSTSPLPPATLSQSYTEPLADCGENRQTDGGRMAGSRRT
jgi:hypothetical protein